MFYSVEDLN